VELSMLKSKHSSSERYTSIHSVHLSLTIYWILEARSERRLPHPYEMRGLRIKPTEPLPNG